MKNLLPLVLLLCVLAACSPKQDEKEDAVVTAPQSIEAPVPQIGNSTAGAELSSPSTSKPLDLSMPENFSMEEDSHSESTGSKNFDASSLFGQEEDSTVSVTVMPSLEQDEEKQSMPEVDGGSVSVKVKTK